MTIKTYVKTGVTWNPSKDIYVKSGGSWRTIKKAWHKTSGTWQLVHNRTQQIPIIANGYNVNLRSVLDAYLGFSQNTAMDIVITVNPGVVIGSTSVSTPGMTTGTFIPGTTVTLVNYGYVVGRGGNGGGCPQARQNGGPALDASSWPLTVLNYGIIGSGGGGGGQGDCDGNNSPSGGGGAGHDPGLTGYGWGGACVPAPASLLLGGVGNWCWYGGDLGQDSAHAYYGAIAYAGAYIVGNANVTWTIPGDLRGHVA